MCRQIFSRFRFDIILTTAYRTQYECNEISNGNKSIEYHSFGHTIDSDCDSSFSLDAIESERR